MRRRAVGTVGGRRRIRAARFAAARALVGERGIEFLARRGIEERSFGFGQILESFGRNFPQVWVVRRNGVRVDFARLYLERGFDVGVGRVFRYAENLVVILSHLFVRPNYVNPGVREAGGLS